MRPEPGRRIGMGASTQSVRTLEPGRHTQLMIEAGLRFTDLRPEASGDQLIRKLRVNAAGRRII